MTELTRMDRVYLRVLVGSLRAIEAQLWAMPPALRLEACLPTPDVVAGWALGASIVLTAAVDAHEPEPVRPTTMGDDVGQAAA